MKHSFLHSASHERYIYLRRLLKGIKQRAHKITALFSILCYGSASYGFNPTKHGKLDDLDLFLIINPDATISKLVESLQIVFGGQIEIETEHIESLLSGKCDICRFYIHAEDVQIGFRVITTEKLIEISNTNGSASPMRNVAAFGQSRIIKDKEWSFISRKYAHSEYRSETVQINGTDVLMVTHRVFSKRKTRLSALGRKLLTASVIYQAKGHTVIEALDRIWLEFVTISTNHHPKISPDEIINSIFRSDKFSQSFRQKLCRKISRTKV